MLILLKVIAGIAILLLLVFILSVFSRINILSSQIDSILQVIEEANTKLKQLEDTFTYNPVELPKSQLDEKFKHFN